MIYKSGFPNKDLMELKIGLRSFSFGNVLKDLMDLIKRGCSHHSCVAKSNSPYSWPIVIDLGFST